MHSTDKGGLNGDTVITLAKYVAEQRTTSAKDMVALAEEKRLNSVKIEFCQRKMSELGQGKGRMERDAVLVVDREGVIRYSHEDPLSLSYRSVDDILGALHDTHLA